LDADRLLTGCRPARCIAVLPSVFAVGHPALEPWAFETAALLHCGDDCVLSHGTAAGLWGMVPEAPPDVSLTIVRRHVRQPLGLSIHRVRDLDVRDVRFRDGLPVTSPARTLIDFAGIASGGVLEVALNEARVLRLVTDQELDRRWTGARSGRELGPCGRCWPTSEGPR
jgi:hypothetical protein